MKKEFENAYGDTAYNLQNIDGGDRGAFVCGRSYRYSYKTDWQKTVAIAVACMLGCDSHEKGLWFAQCGGWTDNWPWRDRRVCRDKGTDWKRGWDSDCGNGHRIGGAQMYLADMCFLSDHVCGSNCCLAVEKGRPADETSFSACGICGVCAMCSLLGGRREEAYFTVEAALVLPMVMLFTVMMIFLAFYSYDRCVMEHSAYEAALRGANSHFRTAQEAEEAARTAAGALVGGKLFAVQGLTYDVRVDATNVTVAYHCTVNMPFATWLAEYVGGIDMTLEVSKSAGRLCPARTIRDFRGFNGLITE